MERAEPAGAPGGGSWDGDGAGITDNIMAGGGGVAVQNAVVWINADRPDVSVIIGGTGGQWPPGHNPSRVVILSNEAGVVVKTPVIG
jgi:hypothetical protein